jgi:DNA-binding NarL/FixJ family response regulator
MGGGISEADAIRVVLADDHSGVRVGIRAILENSAGIKVVGEASNGVEALKQVSLRKPDVLVLDMQMPVLDGLGVIKRLAEEDAQVQVLVLSSYNEPVYINGVLEHGAAGYLTKDESPNRLVEAIYKVAGGENKVFSRKVKSTIKKEIDS